MPSDETEIKAVFFDAAGTLIHLAEPVGNTYARIAADHDFEIDPAATESAFRSTWKTMPRPGSPIGPDQNRAEKNWWRTLVDEVLEVVAPRTGIDRDAYFEDLFESYADPQAWRAYPEVEELLTTLESLKLRQFVLSNFDSRIIPVLEGLGLANRFEQVIYSSAVGHAKPAPEIFQFAQQTADLPPENCLHAGDDPVADWQGAESARFQVYKLDRKSADLLPLLDLIPACNEAEK